MKRYIIKTLIFLSPLLSLFLITKVFYVTNQGDLTRLGFIFDNATYRGLISNKFKNLPIQYEKISNINLEKENKFTVLTIGDSFSEQNKFGYKNYLANNDSISVAHVDWFLSGNPIQTLISLTNGDIFKKLKVEFIVLQSVERYFVERAENIDSSGILLLSSLQKKIKDESLKENKPSKQNLFTDKIIKIPYINLLYTFKDKPRKSKTYKVETKGEFFTGKPNELLFYEEDVTNIRIKNDSLKILRLNRALNYLTKKLKDKGIQLIVIPSPDKYDVYYDFIAKKDKYPPPLFFHYFNSLPKSYLYVNSKKAIADLLKEAKDVYYYDDTHWSPLAAEKIAQEIIAIINKSTRVPNS